MNIKECVYKCNEIVSGNNDIKYIGQNGEKLIISFHSSYKEIFDEREINYILQNSFIMLNKEDSERLSHFISEYKNILYTYYCIDNLMEYSDRVIGGIDGLNIAINYMITFNYILTEEKNNINENINRGELY